MTLRLRQAIAGRPTAKSRYNTCAGRLEDEPFIAYTSGSDVVILDADHDLLETLPFWSALPYRSASSSNYEVQGVTWDQTAALLIAWSGFNIVIWHRRVQHNQATWVPHSTLVASAQVTALDCSGGMVAVGHVNGLELWKHDPKAAIVVWDRLWDRSMPAPVMLAIAPAAGHIAFFATGERRVRILSISTSGAIIGIPQEMRHPRELEYIVWRKPRTSSGDPYLYTITSNSIMRIYAPVLDDPTWFQLHATLDSQSFAPTPEDPAPKSRTGLNTGKSRVRHPLLQAYAKGRMWPLDGEEVRTAILEALSDDAETSLQEDVGREGHRDKVGFRQQDAGGKERQRMQGQVRKVLEAIEADAADLVLWVGEDGVVAMRSVLNMDRKPPTLLKTSLLAHTRIPSPPSTNTPSPPHLIRSPTSGLLQAILPSSSTSTASVQSYLLSLPDLIASKPNSLRPSVQPTPDETAPVQLSSPISAFVRTPNGRGLLSLGSEGEIGVWSKEQRGKPARDRKGAKSLLGRGHWREKQTPELCTIYAKGRAIVFYTKPTDGPACITLQHLDQQSTLPSAAVTLPGFQLSEGDEIKMLSAASDIDDGYSSRERKTQQAVIVAVSAKGEGWVWKVDAKEDANGTDEGVLDGAGGTAQGGPEIRLVSHSTIPCCRDETDDGSTHESAHDNAIKPTHVLPVDPMGWHQSVMDWTTQSLLQDIVLTISPTGVLEFWRPRVGDHVVNNKYTAHDKQDGHADLHAQHSHGAERWMRTGTVKTERTDIRAARCSSRKKTVLVRDVEEGVESGQTQGHSKVKGRSGGMMQEMTIWDSNVGEFSTGLEMCKMYPADDVIQDLDWTTTSDLQSILAVGFPHRIELVCEQRMSYTEGTPGWATFVTIDMTRYCPSPIADSIWLAGGSLAVGCGNQVYLFSRYLDRETPIPTPRSSVRDVRMDDAEPEDVFQLVASQNGPVVDYHPTILAQCVLWDKVDLVKSILIASATALRTAVQEEKRYIIWKRLDPTEFIATPTPKQSAKKASAESHYDALFNLSQPDIDVEDEDPYNPRMIDKLVQDLSNEHVRLPLTRKERSLLATLARAVLEATIQKRALDAGGMRYLFSLRMYVHDLGSLESDLSASASAAGAATKANGVRGLMNGFSHSASSVTLVADAPHKGGSAQNRAPRLSFRNIVWASHSESQEVMLSAATETCTDGKMRWADAKRLGVFLWLRSAETVKSQLEAVARNRFMADDLRDPTSCSLIFFALGKKKVVHGLWRQAPEHKEQNLMLKFLANDFELDRWKLAAKKNAYALLSKQRYEYAAAFFMLAGAPRDAINVVLRQMGDWQLAYALARAVEAGPEGAGPLVKFILEDTVIPMAFEGGHRWLATWAFWMLGRRDLAVQVLISPMTDVASAYSPTKPPDTGFSENDDPSLLLLFSRLKSRTLQTVKGTAAISGRTEFDFVLHNARVFCRMGCHPLALALLREWSFERPELPERYMAKSGKGRVQGGRSKRPASILGAPVGDTPISENGVASPLPTQDPTQGQQLGGAMRRKTSFSLNAPSVPTTSTSPHSPTRMLSYSRMRRPSFMLAAQNNGRRESMLADMEPEASSSDSDADSEESTSGPLEEDGPANGAQGGVGQSGDPGFRKKYGENGTSRPGVGGGFPWDLIPEEGDKGSTADKRSPRSPASPSRTMLKTRQSSPTRTELPLKDPLGNKPTKSATTALLPSGGQSPDSNGQAADAAPDEAESAMPKKGMGNLMKLEQRGDVNQGAAEFSFDNFGF